MSDKGDIQDRISRRAHEIWEREGHPHGRHDEHWAQAEAEIRAEDGAKPAVTPQGPATARKAGAKSTRAAAEDLSSVESAGSTPAAPKATGKAASKPGKSGSAAKPADAKPAEKQARARKDNGKSASTH
ncbi:DUF2934 domain-containing protein [Azospirillum doebereinerae]|uniref:DUF2934 domain-containing protein n=1 Tax=Azospirillum doebereinerae TaxID=92933 RepID=A0A433JCP4_9PROT|nr:DUF2934 domain-containing protein [Azospirillum doebereinerae]MCG5241441.1 DUF2934 domain-containing protein [Azospirillum doebereinerae]RUQ74477.1 DUF2934 domain-containing protein [Azospirillum doebereinerae]